MHNKKFDCVEMKHRGAQLVYKKIKYMSIDEQIEFWKNGTYELRKIHRKSKMQLTETTS